MTLFTPVIDVKHRPYCGPLAIGALTGVPIARIEKMLRRIRSGDYTDRLGRKIPVRGTYTWEVVSVLKRLGCKVTEMKNLESTFGRFCEDAAHMHAAFLVEVTGHFMAVHRGSFCDTAHHEPTPAAGYKKAKRRVRRAWRVEAPATPMYTVADPIAPPAREPAPKPSVREVRAARIAARLLAWEAKQKRAETALRKLRRQARYYGLTTA